MHKNRDLKCIEPCTSQDSQYLSKAKCSKDKNKEDKGDDSLLYFKCISTQDISTDLTSCSSSCLDAKWSKGTPGTDENSQGSQDTQFYLKAIKNQDLKQKSSPDPEDIVSNAGSDKSADQEVASIFARLILKDPQLYEYEDKTRTMGASRPVCPDYSIGLPNVNVDCTTVENYVDRRQDKSSRYRPY
jgi:hypothetical protein